MVDSVGAEVCGGGLSARNNLDDFEAIAGIQDTLGELGWGDRFTIQFDDDGLGSELLVDEEDVDGAGEAAIDRFAVGEEDGHEAKLASKGCVRE